MFTFIYSALNGAYVEKITVTWALMNSSYLCPSPESEKFVSKIMHANRHLPVKGNCLYPCKVSQATSRSV